MSEMPALDKPYFESHLQVTELGIYVAVGVDVNRQSKQFEKTSQCAVRSTVKWSVQSGRFISL